MFKGEGMKKGRKPSIEVGQKYGRWLVLRISHSYQSPSMKFPKWYWRCVCECGVEKDVRAPSLLSGASKSCGCLQKEIIASTHMKHGMGRDASRGRSSYYHMLRRCLDTKEPGYENYGGRGIGVCDRWNPAKCGSFLNFLEDMGERPSKKHSIDRIDVNGDYSPENCRWSCSSDQVFNQRKRVTNRSGRTGVRMDSRRNKWYAEIHVNYKKIWLGYYDTFEEAVSAREEAEISYYGELKPEAFNGE